MPSSIYIHIPFCKSICSYCDFCKFYYNEKWVNNYLNALEKEINQKYKDEEIKTIYIGGGTPSSLSLKELDKLFNIMKRFKTSNEYELTFECNLNDINEDLIKILKNNKVNRISIGIESFNKDNLKFLNRNASFEDTKEKIELIKKYGINNINVDLIYALPSENINILKEDLKLFLKLPITHISTYSLMIENHTLLAKNNIVPISEEEDYKMYKLICDTLKKNGFNHYEISNFAKEGYQSKHNLVYWNNEQYYGFGLGASGYINSVRYTNTRNLNKYLKEDFLSEQEYLDIKEIMNYEIILGLRKLEGINVDDFNKKYNKNIFEEYEVEKLIKLNYLIYKNNYLFINPDKLYVMNEILVQLV